MSTLHPTQRPPAHGTARALPGALASLLACCILAAFGSAALAQTPAQSAATAAAAASQAAAASERAASAAESATASIAELRKLIPQATSMKGDRLTIKAITGGFVLKRGQTDKASSAAAAASAPGTLFAPPQTKLVVTDEDDKQLTVRVRSTPCTRNGAGFGSTISSTFGLEAPVGEGCKVGALVQVGESYTIDTATLAQYGFTQSGWTYGALLLPYKYRFRGSNKGLDPSPTVGPYLGWRLRDGVAGFSWVGSAGLASIKVFDANGNAKTAQGLTWAAGIMFDVSKSAKPFKTGLFFGRDYLGKSEPTFKGGPWLALQIGYDFSE